jgi:U2-associated protein SR140
MATDIPPHEPDTNNRKMPQGFRFSLAGGKSKAPLGSKARAEQDAKAAEEEAARKRVLAEYLDEHGDEDDSANNTKNPLQSDNGPEPSVFVPQGAKRHFAGKPRSTKSGPGTLTEEPLEPFPRAAPTNRFGRWGNALPDADTQFGNRREGNIYTTVVATASNLPPGIDERTVEDLFNDFPNLKVVKVERLPPSGPTEARASAAMKVTFDQSASARDLDDAMNKMNDKKYLGQGYYLHLDRFLERPARKPAKMPFGARMVAPDTSATKFAPTAELGGSVDRSREREQREEKVITAYPPPDLPTLRLIHNTIEGVLAGGMEFEAALMQDPRVKTEERWAWIYDQSHPLNRYYRFRLYQLITGDTRTNVEIFPGMGEWRGAPPFPDEFAFGPDALTPDIEELRPDPEDDTGRRQKFADPYPGMVDTGNGIMSPKARALFIFLLSTFPILKDDVTNEIIAAVTFFAVTHATSGMDEIIDLLITNIFEPFPLTRSNPAYRHRDENDSTLNRDRRECTLNALRIVSDICITANRAGGKAYKYRDAIGTQLVERKVFEYLETLPTKLRMGKLVMAQFRQDVDYVIGFWQNDRLFSPQVLEHIDNAFNERRRQKEEADRQRKQEEQRKRASRNPATGSIPPPKVEGGVDEGAELETNNRAADRKLLDNTNHELQQSSERLTDNQQTSNYQHLDSRKPPEAETTPSQPSRSESLVQDRSMRASESIRPGSESTRDSEFREIPGETAAARARRMRPKAEDMFASDDE